MCKIKIQCDFGLVQVQPFWIMASAGQNCNSACSAFDTADDSFECGKDEMGAINSTQAISDLLVSLNGTCDFADNGNLFRSNAGSPFILPNGDCYYWDPTKPPASIDCDTSPLSNVNRKPLCYCKPVCRQHRAVFAGLVLCLKPVCFVLPVSG